MTPFKFTFIVSTLLLNLTLATSALAKEVALEQASVSAARKDYDRAKDEYDNTSNAIVEQEKRNSEGQARLQELQKAQGKAKNTLEKAKLKLEEKQKILDRAWNSSKD